MAGCDGIEPKLATALRKQTGQVRRVKSEWLEDAEVVVLRQRPGSARHSVGRRLLGRVLRRVRVGNAILRARLIEASRDLPDRPIDTPSSATSLPIQQQWADKSVT